MPGNRVIGLYVFGQNLTGPLYLNFLQQQLNADLIHLLAPSVSISPQSAKNVIFGLFDIVTWLLLTGKKVEGATYKSQKVT